MLVFPLLMVILALYPRREERLAAFTTALVLLSLVSLHGLSLAGAFTALYLIDLIRGRLAERREGQMRPVDVRAHVVAGIVLLFTVAFIGFVLRPAHDLAIKSIVDLRFNPIKMLVVGSTALLDSIAGVNVVSAATGLALLIWFGRRGTLLAFALLTGSLLPISSVYFNLWHEGLFFFALLFTILLTFVRSTERTRFDLVMLVVIVLILADQIYWTARSLRYDIDHEYSGSRQAALFIKDNHLERRRLFGMGFPSLALEPYFPHNIYANYRTTGGFSFWDWSTHTPWFYAPSSRLDPRVMRAWFEAQIAQKPDFVVVSLKFPYELNYVRWFREHRDYRIIQQFDGRLFWKTHIDQAETFLLYARIPPASGPRT